MKFDTEFIKAQLDRRRREGQLYLVAQGSGVSKRTLGYLLAGRGTRAETAAKLHDYLQRTVRRKHLATDDVSPAQKEKA